MIFARRAMVLVLALAFVRLAADICGVPAAAREADIFTVRGVRVDVTDTDAAAAKVRAIHQAQVKAFHMLVRRIASEEAWARLRKLSRRKIGRMMASLSVEEEHTGPRRYIGRLTIRFRADRVRRALREAGAGYVTQQAPAVLVLPVWLGADGPELWRDNPWRAAWIGLGAENALAPVIIPVGDLTDTGTISAREALSGAAGKLQALRMRYDTESVLVAVAEPRGDNSVRATMKGDSPMGRIAFDKTYISTEGGVKAAAEKAAQRFHAIMIYKWKKKVAAQRAARAPARAALRLTVTVPFRSLREWQALRARIRTTPGVLDVNVSTLSGTGAVAMVATSLTLDQLRAALQQNRLALQSAGGRWIIRPY